MEVSVQEVPQPLSPPPGVFSIHSDGRFFLDLFSGRNAPIFHACKLLQVDCISPLDFELGWDILDDNNFEQILRAAWNGFLGGVWSAPPCREYSRLKLRPGGPPALRTPEEPEGKANLSALQTLQLQEQEEIHHRGRQILFAAHSRGAVVGWETPPSAMTLLLKDNTDMLRDWNATCAHVAACQWDMLYAKSWLMCANDAEIASLAGWCSCESPHPSFAGKRTPEGTFVSSLTAEYPSSLAMAVAQVMTKKCTSAGQVISAQQPLHRTVTPTRPNHINDGAGIPSSADWSTPHFADAFATIRLRVLNYGKEHGLVDKLHQHLRCSSEQHPIESEHMNSIKQLWHHWLMEHRITPDWTIPQGQQFRLPLMQSLSYLIQDPDQSLHAHLQRGVPTGALSDMPRSFIWPPKKQDAQDTPELQLCQTNWKGADDDPQLTWSLIQEELDNDWVAEVPGGMEEAQRRWEHLAVGKLNVVHASGRKPRLVLDSSCCGVNTRCVLPETMILPTVDDVKASFQPQEVGGTWTGLSLDIRAAHKQIRLLPQEQGLILFTFQNRLFHYKVAHFGGRFSAFWWSRLGALLLRLLHRYLHQPHRAWLYVDDLFLLAPQHELADMAWSTVVFLTILGTPISWKKAQIGNCITWIGWEFDLLHNTVQLHPDKANKLFDSLAEIVAAKTTTAAALERILGLLIWFTSVCRHLRPHLAPIYKCLYSPPATLYSVPASTWPQFVRCLDSAAIVVQNHHNLMFPIGGKVVEVGHQIIKDRCDLPLAPKTSKLQWVRIAGPQQSTFQLSKEARSKLQWFQNLLSRRVHIYPIVQPRPLVLRAAADAFAEGETFGIGGWIITSTKVGWFSEQFTMQSLRHFLPNLQKDAQKYIGAFEVLAQLALLMMGNEMMLCESLQVCLPSSSDNTGAESGINKQLSTKEPTATFLQLMSQYALQRNIHLLVSHIPGSSNSWADDLSRDRLQQWAHYPRYQIKLADVFSIGRYIKLAPEGNHPDWLTCLTFPQA